MTRDDRDARSPRRSGHRDRAGLRSQAGVQEDQTGNGLRVPLAGAGQAVDGALHAARSSSSPGGRLPRARSLVRARVYPILSPVVSRALDLTWRTPLGRAGWYLAASERIHSHFTGHHRPNPSPGDLELVHVPKTGGTSLRAVLTSLGFTVPPLHQPVPGEAVDDVLATGTLPSRYVTFLRDPVARVWSYFHMCKRGGPRRGVSHDLGLFLAHAWEARDLVVQYLVGAPRTRPGGPELAAAKRVLCAFWFVGDVARFDRDVPELAARIRATPELASKIPVGRRRDGVPTLNVQRDYPPPSGRDIELIAAHNRLDIDLDRWWRRSTPRPRP